MIDFTKDTDWFITTNYYVRKIDENDNQEVRLLLDGYWQHFCDDYIDLGKGVFIQMLNAGLFDRHSQRMMGVIDIGCVNDNSVAKLKIFLHDEHSLPLSMIKELLIWIIDYTFYCLNCSQLVVIGAKNYTSFITMLNSLKFDRFVDLPTVTGNQVNLKTCSELYSLYEHQWLNHDAVGGEPLDFVEADGYLHNIVKPYFQTAISKPLYSTITDFRYEVILCTDQSALSVGFLIGDDAIGTSYKYYSRIDVAHWYFGKWYNDKSADVMHRYARKIFRIKQYVFKTGNPASFIDSLPYDRGIRSYLITFIPIFNNAGNVVAIQSIALNYRLAGYHEYIQNILEQKKSSSNVPQIKLSKREEEVLFLLICGITQEQIAEILLVKRETVASIIRNQLRVKFSLPTASTKLVIETALSYGFPFSIPESLWRPSVIILEDRLTDWLKKYDFVV